MPRGAEPADQKSLLRFEENSGQSPLRYTNVSIHIHIAKSRGFFMTELKRTQTVLGLDLGTNSIGWALIRYEDDKPRELIAAGSRIFQAGVEGTTQDIEQGKDKPRGDEKNSTTPSNSTVRSDAPPRKNSRCIVTNSKMGSIW